MSQFTQLSGVDARLARHETMAASFRAAYGGETIKHRYSEQEEQTIARLALTTVLQTDQNHSEAQIVKELVQVLGTIKDPEFVLKAAVVSRKANFKLFPKVATAALIANRKSIPSWNIYEDRLIRLVASFPPNQILELVLMIKSKLFGKGLGSFEQGFFSRVMQSWKPETLEGHTLANAGDLQRLMRLVHPTLSPVVSFVLDGRPPVTVRQAALKALQESSVPENLIREHKLPFNYTKGIFSNENTKAWEAIRDGMSPMQTLLNLRALDEKGVMSVAKLEEMLSTAENSRLLPVDVLRPVINAPAKYSESLMSLLSRMAPVPLPGLEGLTAAVLLDGSGSMLWRGASSYSQDSNNGVTNWHRGIVMAAPLLALPNRHFMIFDSTPRPEGLHGTPYLKGCPKEAILHNLLGACPGGSTETGRAISFYTQNQIAVDVIFVITDENQNGHMAALKAFLDYQRLVNANAKLVIVNCTNTTWHMAKENHKDVKIIQSMTPLIYEMFDKYDQSTVELIRNWQL